MNIRVLIDGIVQQTTVLIAQLSTTAGVRAPLAHVADEIFRELAREIEAQGVGRKVVADMFGLALRSYQKKMLRLHASTTDRNRTLWQAILEFLQDGSKTRERLLERFQYDGEREVGAVLNDLLSSGLIFSTGKGDQTRYGVTPEAVQLALSADADRRSLANVVWLQVFFGQATTVEAVARKLRLSNNEVRVVVDELVAKEQLVREEGGRLRASNVVIPVGATEGWEAAVLDHFRAVTSTIALKAARGARSERDETLGGTTLTFSVYDGHPYEERIKHLLTTVREQLHALWNEVSVYNEAHPVSGKATQITFYFGQVATELEGEDTDADAPDGGIVEPGS